MSDRLAKWKTLQGPFSYCGGEKKPIVKPETYQVLHSPQMFSSRLYRWSCHHYKPHSDPRQRWTQSPGHSLPSETHIQNRKFHNILSIFYLD